MKPDGRSSTVSDNRSSCCELSGVAEADAAPGAAAAPDAAVGRPSSELLLEPDPAGAVARADGDAVFGAVVAVGGGVA